MHAAGVERREIRDGRARPDLTVDTIARIETHLLAFADFQKRRDGRMIAVVAGVRLGGERLGAVDANGVHGAGVLRENTGARAYTAVCSRSNRRHTDAFLAGPDWAIHAVSRVSWRFRMDTRAKPGADDAGHPVFTAA